MCKHNFGGESWWAEVRCHAEKLGRLIVLARTATAAAVNGWHSCVTICGDLVVREPLILTCKLKIHAGAHL